MLAALQAAVHFAVADEHHADAVLPGHGVVVRQGADFFQRRIFEVLGFVDDDDPVRAVKAGTQRHHLIHLVAALRHAQGAGQQLDGAVQRARAGCDADAHRVRGMVAQELLCALALADTRITVQNDHAMLQLGKADALADILADAGRHICRAGQQTGGLLGGGLGLFIQLEELAQLPLDGFHRAFILLIEVAAQCRAGKIDLGGELVLTDAVRLHVALRALDQRGVIGFLHLQFLLVV